MPNWFASHAPGKPGFEADHKIISSKQYPGFHSHIAKDQSVQEPESFSGAWQIQVICAHKNVTSQPPNCHDNRVVSLAALPTCLMAISFDKQFVRNVNICRQNFGE
jgi:hypothetical protein